mmetsp:Transcript_41840/g.98010  ORF Transcript_41840/g.98010 Transcript_41840/m.98010 type:complete len:819 (-) Transcript_41840:1372-3828(-)
MMSTHERIEGSFEVKGAAMDASPSLTIGSATSASRPSSCSDISAACPATPTPYFLASAFRSSTIAFCTRAYMALAAPICPPKPDSPRAARARSSSWSHCCCLAWISFFFRSISTLNCDAASFCFAWSSVCCFASLSSADSPPSTLGPPPDSSLATLALPNPVSSDTPTWADLSAPTSLPPSPHIRTRTPARSCIMRTTLALPGGDIRAKTQMQPTCDQTSPSLAVPAASSASSVTISACCSARLAISVATNGCTISEEPPRAATHRTSSPVRMSRSGCFWASAMCVAFATCSAVSGASPVIMYTACAESTNALRTVGESERVLHAKATKPAKVRRISAHSRGLAVASASELTSATCLLARASTRSPRSAIERYASSYHEGTEAGSSKGLVASGEPLRSDMYSLQPLLSVTCAITDMRCNADEKWCRCTMRTHCTAERATRARASSRCVVATSSSRSSFLRSSLLNGGGGGGGGGVPSSAVSAAASGGFSFVFKEAMPRSRAAVSPGVAVCVCGSYFQPTPCSAATSIGSPSSSAPAEREMSEWQPASTSAVVPSASSTGCCAGHESVPLAEQLGLRMPTGTSLSEVSVPVLSKHTASTLPATGSRKGSVQKMPALKSAIRAVFTAMAVCIGKWRGTTEVRMMTHLSRSSCVVRSPFSSPRLKTYADDASAKQKSSISAPIVSFESSETGCCANSIICMSSPCAEEKPERSTKQTAPPSGGAGTEGTEEAEETAEPGVAAMSEVPAKRVCTRCVALTSRRVLPAAPSSWSFICGTDSPVRLASFTTAVPRSSKQSHGTMSRQPPTVGVALAGGAAEACA